MAATAQGRVDMETSKRVTDTVSVMILMRLSLLTLIIYCCSSNYLKPGCKIRGGKQGVDFFNGEDALLAHVKADKDLCVRLNLTNIMVRPNAVPLGKRMRTSNMFRAL